MFLMSTAAIGIVGAAQAREEAPFPADEQTAEATSWVDEVRDFLSVGPFDVDVNVGVAEEFTDNVFVTTNNKQSDFVTVVEPEVNVSVDVGRHDLSVYAAAELARFADHDSEDYEDYKVGADGKLRFDGNTFLFGGAEYAWEHEGRESPDDVNGVDPTEYEEGFLFGGIAHRSDQFVFRFGGTAIDLDFDDVAAAGGGTINNDDRDRTMYEVGARVGYRLDPIYELFVQAAYDNRDYDAALDDFGFNRDSDGVTVAGGARATFSPQLQAEAHIGLLSQDFDDPALSNVNTLDFGGRADWQLTPPTRITAFVDRTLEETTVVGSSGYLRTTGGARVQHEVRPDLSTHGHLYVTENDYQGGARTDHLINAGLGVKWYFLPNFYTGLDYSFLQRDSDTAGADFDENVLMVRLGAQLAPAFTGNPGDLVEALTDEGLGGFYVGAQVGHGNINTALDGPRGAFGRNTTEFGDDGFTGGVFAGYGVLVGDFYVGGEVDFEDSEAAWSHITNNRLFTVNKSNSFGVSARVGYELQNHSLLYGRFGIVGTEFETFYRQPGGTRTMDERELGMRFGGGAETPITSNLFARMEYTYTAYEDFEISGAGATDNFANSESIAKFGLAYRFGGGVDIDTQPADFSGFYAGVQGGHGAINSRNQGTRVSGPVTISRSGHGATGGVFAGYGETLDDFYIGGEVEADFSSTNWNIERNPTGRVYSVEKEMTYGGGLRLGYVLNDTALIYARAGYVWSEFDTDYLHIGPNNFVSPEDTVGGVRLGGGVEMAADDDLFFRLDYTHTDYDSYQVNYISGVDSFDNSENLFRIGFGYRM
jgi:hypothetical protein